MEKQINESQSGASSKMHKQMPLAMTLTEVLRKYQSHPEFLGLVLSDPNQKGAMEDSPLHIAARKGELEDIEVLVAHGGNVNLIGDIGNSPLHEASLAGRVLVVNRLLELGADPSIRNEFAQTALDMALSGNHADIVAILKNIG
jgi:ankyrin repeat protein